MKRNFEITFVTIVFLFLIVSVSYAAETFSDNWYQSGSNWRIRNGKGKDIANAWICDDAVPANGKSVWYLIDEAGNMYSAALVQDGTGNFYSLETSHNGYYGMLRTQSGTYGGIYLSIDSSHNGSYGAIKNQDGIDALMANYGVKHITINNSNIIYTAKEKSSSSGTADNIFSKINEKKFSYAAGAAGMRVTEFTVNKDGHFNGTYDDYLMGRYTGCELHEDFQGDFGNLKKIDELTYSLQIISSSHDGTEEPDGITNGAAFTLHLPGTPIKNVEEYLYSTFDRTVLDTYLLTTAYQGFNIGFESR